MQWDPEYQPRIRPLEAFPLPHGGDAAIGVRDPGGLSDVVLALSGAAAHIVGLMDGTHTCAQIREKFAAAAGQPLPADTLQSMLDNLERAHFLEGPGFESHYAALLDEYRRDPVRRVRADSTLNLLDDSGRLFDEMLDEVEPTELAGPVVGLVAPHLDYPRGAPCYAQAYATLRGRTAPDRVVILGTNHFGRSPAVVATANDFATPLGTTRTAVDFLERLEARCAPLRTYELDHVREHSIELQLAWLQHLFGADAFQMVPFLCPDPCGPTETAPHDGQGIDLRAFATTLGELVAEDSADTLIVAGADLSHTGAAFGDQRQLDDGFLQEIRQRDERALACLTASDPSGWIECIGEGDNPTRVCSAGCVFAVATALPEASVTVLGYHQAVDQPSQTCVTCAAVALT